MGSLHPRRARDLGIRVGRYAPGPLNSITDVEGVRVGQRSVIRHDDGDPHAVRTGVTAIFPHAGEPWAEHVYAAADVLNGYGELIGINQIQEWGLLMSPIVLTSSLQIGKAYDATVKWIETRDRVAAAEVMPVVSECDDSFLSDLLSFPLSDEDVFAALDAATGGPVQEGNVGAGTGMHCFGFKGGIGTASRRLEEQSGGYTVGVLVLTNYGVREELRIDGVRVGMELATDDRRTVVESPIGDVEGSCVVVVATDAPLLPHQLRRIARRAGLGLARTGSYASNTSGEQMLAFSTSNRLPAATAGVVANVQTVADGVAREPWLLSALFLATAEATEEAVVNALVAAATSVGRDGHTLEALPIDRTLEILRRHDSLHP